MRQVVELGAMFAIGMLLGTVVSLVGVRRHRGPTSDRGLPGLSPELHAELERARRYDLRFALIRLRDDRPAGQQAGPRLEELRLVRRRTDRTWRAGDHHYLLLPQTSAAGADVHLRELRASHPEATFEAQVACFPDDGLTVPALLAALEQPARNVASDRRAFRARQVAS